MLKITLWYSVQFSHLACLTLCDPKNCNTPGLPVHHQHPEFTQTHVHRISDAIQPSHPLSSPSPPAPIPPSIRVFSNESTLHIRCPKYWSFSFSITGSKENQGILLKGYIVYIIPMSLVQSVSSVTQSCPTLCDPMNRSTPGLPVHHHLPEFTQTHIHRISDAIQPSHPLSYPSPPAPNPSQHQSLFQLVNFSHEVAKVLEFQL